MEDKKQLQIIFGEVLHTARMEKKLKQAELAEICDMDDTYISDLERGNYMPSLFTFLKLSKGLGLSLSELGSRIDEFIGH
ncbi:MAG: helix-turn-helix transcriptional regulator [Balneola sp.]